MGPQTGVTGAADLGPLVLGIDGGNSKVDIALAAATKQQFDRMVALGLGGLDKSGVAELTFKGRHA